jgi:hypothetical protein
LSIIQPTITRHRQPTAGLESTMTYRRSPKRIKKCLRGFRTGYRLLRLENAWKYFLCRTKLNGNHSHTVGRDSDPLTLCWFSLKILKENTVHMPIGKSKVAPVLN